MRMSFPLQMALATVLGIFTGLFIGEWAAALAPWADAYVMILKITAIPYLAVAIVHGIALLSRSQAMQILKKGSIFIGLALAINISMIYLMQWAFPASVGSHQAGFIARDVPSLNFAELLIPENIFYNLANNVVPAVVVFSLLIGIALMHLADKQPAMSILQTLLDALTRVTGWIGKITPLGTFIIMAKQVGTVQFSTIKQMSTYIILFAVACCIIVFWIAPRLVSMFTSLKSAEWIKNLFPVLVLAFTTNLVIICLPYIINMIQEQMQKLFPKDENARNQIQGTVSIVFNLPLGSMFMGAFVLFAAIFYSIHLTIQSQFQLFLTVFLTSLGSVGIGSAINSLGFILDTLNMPIEAIDLFLTGVPFTQGFQSMVSAMLISTLAFLITLAGRGLLRLQWPKIMLSSAFTILPILFIFGSIKWIDALPRVKNESKSIYELEIASDTKTTVFDKGQQLSAPDIRGDEGTFARILRTQQLRVGYDPNSAPFCFFNKNHQLVGYDIAYAYQLAYDLGCDKIDFIPLTHDKIGQQLSEGLYDIAMSAISISEERLKQMSFPSPYLEAKVVFVTRDRNRKRFASLDDVKANRSIKIAVLVNTAYQETAYQEFPNHEIILLHSHEEFDTDQPPADILIWEEQEAIAWVAAHPQFHVIAQPQLGKEMLGYPIKENETAFLSYLNTWLTLKDNDGFKDQQYNLWILGHTNEVVPVEPRWSIMQDVLHWVD